MKKQTRDYHAKLTIHGLPDMSKATLRRLKNWLKVQALVVRDAKEYSGVYTARLMK